MLADISAIDCLKDYSDIARASVIGTQMPDRMDLGSHLGGKESAGISAIDRLMDYSDIARASVIGLQMPDRMDLGLHFGCKDNLSGALDELAGDRMDLGSHLGSKMLAGISAIDCLKDYSDLARASVIGTQMPDRIFAHDRSSSILWPRCGPEISRSEKLCKLDSESENRDETDIAQSIQRLLITCNRAKKIDGKDAIFKYTDKFVEAIVTLSRINSGDEHSLGDLVDALYLLVYEGAGKDKLRFLCDFGGPLKSQDCEFVWHLKHLRNKWLRHDIEHGNEKSIKRSWKELKEALDFFGLAELPTDIEEFKYLHLNILRNAEFFLTSMHDAVIENHAS